MPTPGTFPDLYKSNNTIIPILPYTCHYAISLMPTLNSKLLAFTIIMNTNGENIPDDYPNDYQLIKQSLPIYI